MIDLNNLNIQRLSVENIETFQTFLNEQPSYKLGFGITLYDLHTISVIEFCNNYYHTSVIVPEKIKFPVFGELTCLPLDVSLNVLYNAQTTEYEDVEGNTFVVYSFNEVSVIYKDGKTYVVQNKNIR